MSANVTEDEIRARIGAALSSLGTVRSSRMGAGNDDIEVPRRYLRALSDGGWAVPSWPAEYGGRGMSSAAGETVRAILAGLPKPDLYPFLVGIDLIGPSLLVHGTEEQKRRWLRPIADGSEIWCQMFSEPSAGSTSPTSRPGPAATMPAGC